MAAKPHPMAAASELFRAEIRWHYPEGSTKIRHEGPYPTHGLAQSRITFWTSFFERENPEITVDGDVQSCSPTWVKAERPQRKK